MPTPGLSLVGFLDQPQAIDHFRRLGLRTDPDAALVADWQAARANLGPAIVGAGNPNIQAIPAAHMAHITQLTQADWMQEAIRGGLHGQFQMVEIAKLLAGQITVSLDQANFHAAGGFSNPPTMVEMLNACLPINAPSPRYIAVPGVNSVLITGTDLNLLPREGGHIRFQVPIPGAAAGTPPIVLPPVGGVVIGARLPLVHVVAYNGRHYLLNGFHRVYALGRAGAIHVPCLVRPAARPEDAGINPPGTFDEALLTSNNPPTAAHYIQGRALSMPLRTFRKAVHVSWAEHVYPAE